LLGTSLPAALAANLEIELPLREAEIGVRIAGVRRIVGIFIFHN
jgi:hypothetical protein